MKRFPTRFLDDRWQVLVERCGWVSCESKVDADSMAACPQLAMQAMGHLRAGPDFSRELADMAKLLEKYGRRSDAEFFRVSSQRVHG